MTLRAGAESLLGEGRGLCLARQSWQMTAARRRTDATLSTETLISVIVLIAMGCFLMLFDDGVVAVPYGYHDGYYCRLGPLPVTAAHHGMHNCTESHGQITSHHRTANIHAKVNKERTRLISSVAQKASIQLIQADMGSKPIMGGPLLGVMHVS